MQKPQAFYFQDHIMFLTEQEPLKPHKHLAAHLVIALDEEMTWQVGKQQVNCRGIYIDGNVEHIGKGTGRFLTFLFVETSDYACTMEKVLLQDRRYAVLNEHLAEQVSDLVACYEENPQLLDEQVLELCKITKEQRRRYDVRVEEAIKSTEALETITPETISVLSGQAYLSQSRFSHLFKAETGMSLASYLAFEKLRKTYQYIMEGKNITQSCILAGFDTPSHCAATCTKMFGISLKQIAFI